MSNSSTCCKTSRLSDHKETRGVSQIAHYFSMRWITRQRIGFLGDKLTCLPDFSRLEVFFFLFFFNENNKLFELFSMHYNIPIYFWGEQKWKQHWDWLISSIFASGWSKMHAGIIVYHKFTQVSSHGITENRQRKNTSRHLDYALLNVDSTQAMTDDISHT